MSIERNNSVVVIFRHLLPLLSNLYFISCLSLIFLYVMFSLLFLCHPRPYFSFCHVRPYFLYSHPRAFFYVMFGLVFFMSCSGLTRTSLSWIPGTRCACPRMTEEKIILLLPALFFFLSLPDLIRQSRDFPVKPWNDRKE